MTHKKIYELAIKTYGEENQQIVAIEELAELQKEITKSLRGEHNKNNIIEEMADVEIMLKQLRLIYEIDASEVIRQMHIKISRLENRLKEFGDAQ